MDVPAQLLYTRMYSDRAGGIFGTEYLVLLWKDGR